MTTILNDVNVMFCPASPGLSGVTELLVSKLNREKPSLQYYISLGCYSARS